jgi:hypothetical protein
MGIATYAANRVHQNFLLAESYERNENKLTQANQQSRSFSSQAFKIAE